MTENKPVVHFYLEGKMRADEFHALVVSLGKHMLSEEVKFGQTELDLHDIEREELKHSVSVDAARDFYQRFYRAPKPSALAAAVMSEIANTVADEDKKIDKRGRLLHVSRAGWDQSYADIVRGESIVRFKPGSEKRRFIESFNLYLPEIDSGE